MVMLIATVKTKYLGVTMTLGLTCTGGCDCDISKVYVCGGCHSDVSKVPIVVAVTLVKHL